MTKEEITAKSQEKVKAVSTLCEQLKLVITAEEMITKEGLIKRVVYYTDAENYNAGKKPLDTVIEKEEVQDFILKTARSGDKNEEKKDNKPNKEENENPVLEP